MAELIYKNEVYAIVGAGMEVYNELGAGFLEPVYQEAFEMELCDRHVPFEPQKELRISYKGRTLTKTYIADGIAYGKIVIELKALNALTSREESQMLNYLKATGFEVGVLLNFGVTGKLEWKRIVKTQKPSINDINLQQ
jgi:GxxExxY protein